VQLFILSRVFEPLQPLYQLSSSYSLQDKLLRAEKLIRLRHFSLRDFACVDLIRGIYTPLKKFC
jgi:hypothetical protein